MPDTDRKPGRGFGTLWTAATVSGLGAALGGLASTYAGLTAPFLIGFTAMTAVTVTAWGTLNNHDIRAIDGRHPLASRGRDGEPAGT